MQLLSKALASGVLLAGLFQVLGAGFCPLRAQDAEPGAEQDAGEDAEQELTDRQVRARMDVLLRERERIRYPNGRPSQSVGNEQQGNDLRSPTPALVNSDRAPVFYDEDEQYDRSLAMYEQGATYTRAPHPVQALSKASSAPAAKDKRAKTPAAESEQDDTNWMLIAGALAGAGISFFVISRASSKS